MKDPIVQVGDPVLRQKAKPVLKKEFGSRKLAGVIQKMKKALAPEIYGVAIAAPQVGVPLRVFVVGKRAFAHEALEEDENLDEKAEEFEDKVFINPEIIRTSRKKVAESEGCLSVRDIYGTVLRYQKTTIRAQDEDGETFTYHGSGLVAHIFQHEVDHLDGILFIDKAQKVHEQKK